jgi:hypothetical protein
MPRHSAVWKARSVLSAKGCIWQITLGGIVGLGQCGAILRGLRFVEDVIEDGILLKP